MTWIDTAAGPFDYTKPAANPRVFAPDVIAQSLARMPRFLGHGLLNAPLSVAAHSILVAHLLSAQGFGRHVVLLGLLHDAHESLVGDCPAPLKAMLLEYRVIEDQVQAAALAALAPGRVFTPEDWSAVKYADLQALRIEGEMIFECSATDAWTADFPDTTVPHGDLLNILTDHPEIAEPFWRAKYAELTHEGDF